MYPVLIKFRLATICLLLDAGDCVAVVHENKWYSRNNSRGQWKPHHLRMLPFSGLARKKEAGAWPPLAFFYPRRVVSYRWSKNNILASLSLASYLPANCLQKLETKQCAYYAEAISVFMCVCVCVCVCVCRISIWFIYNETKLRFCKISIFVPYT